MRAALLMIPLVLSSAACSSQDDFARETGVSDSAAQATAGASAQKPALEGLSVKETAEKNGGTWEFAYSYPKAVAAEPALAEQLTAEKDKALANEKAGWNGAQADSPPDCSACRSRGYEKEWKVVADLPNWLSLSADTYTYTGGAHGMSGLQSLVWNKKNDEGMEGVELFTSAAALEAALGDRLCKALNAERQKKRGEPVDSANANYGFNECQPIKDSTVLVGSSNGKTFDRMTVYFGPYVAGPYAEGAYELDFPVTAAVLDAVKPEYRGSFSVKS
ncbi:DUF3298 and DUF4163 domain-containing protein [Qipengyuania sp.]|uniref:DUF3298 and DUF4163 domain-containing protein n=1 Tax=Qipengyuania sp. TaxID=2004515 RepID=UPI0035C7901A